MCDWLEVSPSGFYAWINREASKRYQEDQELLELISQIYWASEGRYGSPRVHKALQDLGIATSKKRVARLMREAGLVGRVTQVTYRHPSLKRVKAAGDNLLLDMTAPDDIKKRGHP
ncbi:IS3 family transposase [Pseudomonadota bacterium]